MRVPQVAQHRQAQTVDKLTQLVSGNGAGLHTHAHNAYIQVGQFLFFGQFVQEVTCGVHVKQARLQRHDELGSHAHHIIEAPAVQATWGVQHHMGGALGGFDDQIGRDIPGGNGPGLFGPQTQPQTR